MEEGKKRTKEIRNNRRARARLCDVHHTSTPLRGHFRQSDFCFLPYILLLLQKSLFCAAGFLIIFNGALAMFRPLQVDGVTFIVRWFSDGVKLPTSMTIYVRFSNKRTCAGRDGWQERARARKRCLRSTLHGARKQSSQICGLCVN